MLNELEFKFTKKKMEFLNLTKGSSIYSIRFGQVNTTIAFINHTDYSVIKTQLIENKDQYIINYECNDYTINKSVLNKNNLVKFDLIN